MLHLPSAGRSVCPNSSVQIHVSALQVAVAAHEADSPQRLGVENKSDFLFPSFSTLRLHLSPPTPAPVSPPLRLPAWRADISSPGESASPWEGALALSGSKWLSLFVSSVVYFLLRSPRAGRREGTLSVGEKHSVARQGGLIPLSSLQSVCVCVVLSLEML